MVLSILSLLLMISIINISVSLPLGGNTFTLADWTRSLPYVNLVKQGRNWGTADNPFNGNATVDPATGWPTCDFGMVLASLNLDLGGTYLFHGIGNATIENWQGKVHQTYDPATNTLTANLSMTESSVGIVIVLRNTTGPGLRNISLLQPGYDLSRANDFTDLFLAHMSRFSVIRFMDWTGTNSNLEAHWNETTSVYWPQYTAHGKHNPWLTIPTMVNQFNTSTDVWINIPHNADDDYIIHIARMLFSELNPRSNIYTEYSNEVFNWEFPQFFANYDAANESVLNQGDPYHLAYDNATNPMTWANRRVAYQAKRMSDLFKTVFGEENVGPFKRIRPICSGSLLDPNFAIDGLNYLNANYGPPSNYVHGIIIAPYFTLGPYDRMDNLTVDQVLEGFNISVQEMLPETGWGAQQLIGIHATYAGWYNVSVHAYEGGADTSWGCGKCSLDAKGNATRDPRLTDISVQHLKGWYRYGFQPYNWYASGAGATLQYGSYTLLEDMRQETRIDTTKMFGPTSPVAKLPRPAPKLKAMDIICDTPASEINLTFGIPLPAYNFNATNYMGHPTTLHYPDLRNLTANSTFFYPIQIFQSPIKLNLTVYVAGNASLLEAAISNSQFTQVETPQTLNTTTFQPTPTIQFNINQGKLPSIVTLRLRNLQAGFSIRSFDLVPITTKS